MKNGLLIWNVVLTMVAGYLLFTHFSSKKTASTAKNSLKDSAVINSSFRIAYFEMDSIESSLFTVRDLRVEMTKREDAIDQELEGLKKNFQQRYNYFQSQAQSGSLTQAQSEAANREMKNLDDAIRNRKQELEADYNDFVTRNQTEIKTKIKDFLKEYNRDRKFAYIVADDLGLFYHKDSVYNITTDVIRGLNERYKSKKD